MCFVEIWTILVYLKLIRRRLLEKFQNNHLLDFESCARYNKEVVLRYALHSKSARNRLFHFVKVLRVHVFYNISVFFLVQIKTCLIYFEIKIYKIFLKYAGLLKSIYIIGTLHIEDYFFQISGF